MTGIKDCGETKEVITVEKHYVSRAVIIATGSKNRTLNLSNETELIGKGVSYCATCDGMFFRNRDVAVVGGGNTAFEDALFLSNYCNKVYIIHRRDTFRGEKHLEEVLKLKENVEFVLDSFVEQINGEKMLESVNVRNIVNDEIHKISISGLFIAVGRMPDNSAFSNLINLDEHGYIIANEDCRTNCQGIFAAGDCRTKMVRQLTTATSDGAVASLGACTYIDQMG